MAGFGDPSSRQVLVVEGRTGRTAQSPGVTATLSASGRTTAQPQVVWEPWNRVYVTERLKQGARDFRDALVDLG
jgi:hypothetical protein